MSHGPTQVDLIKKRHFVRSRDGQVIFYPFGPWIGYILPDRSVESEIVSEITFSERVCLLLFAVTTVFGIIVNMNGLMLLIAGLVYSAVHYFLMRRLICDMFKLPRSFSLRLAAVSKEQHKLWAGLIAGVAIVVAAATIVCVQWGRPMNIPGLDLFAMIDIGAIGLVVSFVNGRLLVVLRRELYVDASSVSRSVLQGELCPPSEHNMNDLAGHSLHQRRKPE